MKKTFYEHLVQIDFLHEELDSLNLSSEEKEELLRHVHGSIHYAVLDVVLSELPEEHKKTFINNVNSDDHNKIWELLREVNAGIEEKIRSSIHNVAKEFIREARLIREKHGK